MNKEFQLTNTKAKWPLERLL